MKRLFLSLIFLLFMIVSCGGETGEKPVNKGLAGFKVEFAENFDPGTPEKPLAEVPAEIPLKITALGYDNKPLTDYHGKIRISLQSTRIKTPKQKNRDFDSVTVINFKENITVTPTNCADKDRVVVEDVEIMENNGESDTVPLGKIGVSPFFYTPVATISMIQGNVMDDKGYPSKFNGRNLTLKAGKDKQMVVVAIIEGGFYLHEVGAEEYSSIYMYTYSTPYVDDNVDESVSLPVGALIESANGSVFEFFGFTEMSFPTFHPVYETKNGKKTLKIDPKLIPQPKDISDILDKPKEMEKYEASLVTVNNVYVAWFNENDDSFIEYSQFPLTLTGNPSTSDTTIMAQTLYTAPLFNAVTKKPKDENSEKCHYNFTGILRQHTSARPSTWIIVPRDMNDIEPLDSDPDCKLESK